MRSNGSKQYKRVIALSVNFDEAFLDDDLPGLDSSPSLDFAAQMDDLELLSRAEDDQQTNQPRRCTTPAYALATPATVSLPLPS